MNRLAFGEFHQKHFGPEQTAYWSLMIQQQQQQYEQAQQYYSYENDYSQQPIDSRNYAQDQYQDPQQNQYEYHEEEEEELSKEAIEIFRFSEAYRKEKELARLEAEQEETKGMQDWQYDESNVLCSGGQEAPVTSLVLTQPETTRPVKHSHNRIQEELLNSAYLSSCRHDQVVLWPVIPFKL
jgi:hypothetical protein